MHRYRDPKEEDGTPYLIESGADRLTTEDLDQNDDEDEEPMQVYEQHNPALHGPQVNRKQKICTKLFMKKYIAVAKMIQPKIKAEAASLLAEEYARLRSHEMLEDNQNA